MAENQQSSYLCSYTNLKKDKQNGQRFSVRLDAGRGRTETAPRAIQFPNYSKIKKANIRKGETK